MKTCKPLFFPILILTLFFSFWGSALVGHAQADDQEWSTPVNLSLSGSATNPVMVVDFQGRIHAIWVDSVDGYKYAQSADGIQWTKPKSVKFPFGPKDPSPVLLSDSAGSIYLFWLSNDGSLFYGQTTPSDFADPGSWLSTSRLARDVLSFDVILDATGAIHLAYIRKASAVGNPAGVYYRRTNVAGGGWLEAVNLYESEYYRSTKQNDAYIRLAASNSTPGQNIYVTWDNRAQKRVYMAVSTDSGVNWGEAQQIKGPEDTGGIDSPFNLSVAAFDKNVLLLWQVGEPGSSKCTLYSQWSEDYGNNWDGSVAVLGGRSDCPLGVKFVSQAKDYMEVYLIGQVTPTLIAWNGEKWSGVQPQVQLPSFSNPLTFDPILLGCRFDIISKDRLYVVGCDQGRGGDVWFLARVLEPVENWFTPSVIWSEPVVLSAKSEVSERISNFFSASDGYGNIHAVWVQSPVAMGRHSNMQIEYARWNGSQWTTPESIFTSLSGTPIQLLLIADPLDRLLLSWIDGHNGDLIFSWANLERANLSSEWLEPSGLPSPSSLLDSSDVVVGGAGRIVYAYAVSVNEERGIYIVQSNDNGENWSVPVRAFDAVSVSWEKVEQPRLALSSDGILHLIFIRDAFREGQATGLYYSRSTDGGVTWGDAQIISESEIQWADIASYGDKTIHIAWQEYDGLVFANISQLSKDSGVTWGKQNNITGVNEAATPVYLASDVRGLLHFVQLVNKSDVQEYGQKGLVLQDWKWDGSAWNLELHKDLIIEGENVGYALSANITSNGYLGVFIQVEYTDLAAGFKSEILTLNRFLGDPDADQIIQIPVIPTPISESNAVIVEDLQPTPTPDFSILYNDNVSTSPLERNIAGLVLIGVGVLVTLILLIRRRPAKSNNE